MGEDEPDFAGSEVVEVDTVEGVFAIGVFKKRE